MVTTWPFGLHVLDLYVILNILDTGVRVDRMLELGYAAHPACRQCRAVPALAHVGVVAD